MTGLSAQELQTWLEWAGSRLIALPVGKIKPKEYHVCWPEYSQEIYQVLHFRNATTLKPPPPASDEIPMVDEILALPNLCASIPVRRILHVRSLVHPLNGRYLYKWPRIAELLDIKVQTVKAWHAKGLQEVINKAPREKVCRIHQFMQDRL